MARRKATALDKAEQARRKRGGGRRNDPLWLITMAILGLAAAAAIVFGAQLAAILFESFSASSLDRQATGVKASVESVIQSQRNEISRALSDDDVRSLIADPDRWAEAEGKLSNLIPGSPRVVIVPPAVESQVTEAHPALSYASIDMLVRARNERRLQPAELHNVGTEQQTLSYVYPVRVEGDLQALVLVARADERLLQAIGNLSALGGGVAVTQGSGRPDDYVVAEAGDLGLRFSAQESSTEISDSTLRVVYSVRPVFSLLATRNLPLVATGLAASLLLIVGLLYYRRRAAVLQERTEVEAFESTEVARIEEDRRIEESMAFTKDLSDGSGVDVESLELDSGIFRAYDIRGIVGQGLTSEVAELIGRAVGSEIVERGLSDVVVARDGRLSGPDLIEGLTRGLQSAGVDVSQLGAVPTPVLYFATHEIGTGSGVMVTGSHNPPEYNGFKIMVGGDTLSGDAIKDLYQRIVENRLSSGEGGLQEIDDIVEQYVDRIASDVQVEVPLKVVVDAGNGIAGDVAPKVLEEIGCEVVPLYCDVDGNFPNHHPDPSDPKNLTDLIAIVEQSEADLGVAFDGDGDRLGVVTNTGENIFPDRLLMLFAQDVLTRNPGGAIIYDVKCTGKLADAILGAGGSPIMWKTGHSFIKSKMKEIGAELAGEMSGHFFFKERWYGFDDGIYAAARLLEILAADGREPAEILEELPSGVSTPELKIEMNEGEHYTFIEEFAEQAAFDGARLTRIDGVRADYEDGWGLVRCSNTTPCLVLRFDADTEDALERIQNEFREQLLAVRDDLTLPF